MALDPKGFQESITMELSVVKNRVRNLIGAANRGEEGLSSSPTPQPLKSRDSYSFALFPKSATT